MLTPVMESTSVVTAKLPSSRPFGLLGDLIDAICAGWLHPIRRCTNSTIHALNTRRTDMIRRWTLAFARN